MIIYIIISDYMEFYAKFLRFQFSAQLKNVINNVSFYLK